MMLFQSKLIVLTNGENVTNFTILIIQTNILTFKHLVNKVVKKIYLMLLM